MNAIAAALAPLLVQVTAEAHARHLATRPDGDSSGTAAAAVQAWQDSSVTPGELASHTRCTPHAKRSLRHCTAAAFAASHGMPAEANPTTGLLTFRQLELHVQPAIPKYMLLPSHSLSSSVPVAALPGSGARTG